jgi:hypothetical protein
MMRHRVYGIVLILAGALAGGGCEPEIPVDPEVLARLPAEVDYNFHIKPLLSDRCYACHGPDEGARKAGLLLFTEDGAKGAPLEAGGRAIVEGSLRRSAVFDRIFSTDPDHVMPPPESNLALSDYEKALLARWIEQGAVWKPHCFQSLVHTAKLLLAFMSLQMSFQSNRLSEFLRAACVCAGKGLLPCVSTFMSL